MVKRFAEKATAAKASSLEDYEATYRKVCKDVKDKKEKNFCYYVGASDISASTLLRVVSTPMKAGVPPESICNRLRSKDSQICLLSYGGGGSGSGSAGSGGKTVPNEQDLRKMKIRELKDLLEELGGDCKGCGDKSDYIRQIEALRNKKDAL
jgi:hypothetical protein